MSSNGRPARFVEHARLRAELGWALIPLDGKAPRSKNWQTATVEPAEFVAGQWAEYGKRWNMGVVLGPSGLVVIEDDRDDDHALLLELFGGRLPDVPIVRSGGRSLHLYFLDDGLEPVARDGLELRCGRQQVVLPPSVHPVTGREYEWLPGHEPDAPGVALTGVPETARCYFQAPKPGRGAEPVGNAIGKGGRHRTLVSLAGSMRRPGMSGDEIAVALLAVNARRCKPPLPDAEVVELARDVARRYEPAPPDPVREELGRLAEQLLEGEPAAAPAAAAPKRRTMVRRPMSAIRAERVEWLIDKVVPVGTLTLVAGVGGLGKSALMLAWAKQITDAGENVLIISYEDAAGPVIRPRFEALGGDLDLLHELHIDAFGGEVSFPTDLGDLDRHIRETRARAVLIDPVSASLDLTLNAHRDQDVRVVLGQLARIAERERLAVIENAHLNKAPSSDPYLRINGSTAFYNGARSVLTVTRDPEEPDWHRLVAHHKSNYGQLAPVERWRVEMKAIPGDVGLIEVMTMEFVEVADDVARDHVLAPATIDKTDAAVEFLRDELADGDWHDSSALKNLTTISARTLQRAAHELDVEHDRRGFPSTTWWKLPQSRQASPTAFGATGENRLDKPFLQSRQIVDVGVGATVEQLPCTRYPDLHPGLHKVTNHAAGLVYLACGCHTYEEDPDAS